MSTYHRTAQALAPLFAGHDDGAWTLPAPLAAARRAVTDLEAALAAVPAPDAREKLLTDTIDAATAGDPLPDLAAAHAAHQADLASLTARDTYSEALTHAQERLADVAVGTAEASVHALRPALDAVLDDAAAAYETFRHITHDTYSTHSTHYTHGLLFADAATSEAYIKFNTIVARYVAVRAARTTLHNRGYRSSADTVGRFAVFPDGGSRWSGPPTPPPWPTGDARALLTWALDNRVRPWLPTVAEQDQAAEEQARLQRAASIAPPLLPRQDAMHVDRSEGRDVPDEPSTGGQTVVLGEIGGAG